MDVDARTGEVRDLDEGSWVYLSLGVAERGAGHDLRQRVVDVCEESGWPAVSWSPTPHEGNVFDSARFFDGMSHAVEHADAVVVVLDDPSPMTDVEIAFAYTHNRPIVGLRVGNRDSGSEVQGMLRSHGRAYVVDCADIDECVDSLRQALSNPRLSEAIREAAGEQTSHA